MSYKRNLDARPLEVAKQLTGDEAITMIKYLEGLPITPTVRETVIAETRQFMTARVEAGMGMLAMGEHLSKLRKILEPVLGWKKYLALLPNITQATAYRFIWAWENAQRALPGATLAVALKDGYKLISQRKDETFAPGYQPAVASVIREIGPAPETDTGRAKEWLDHVVRRKREMAKATVAVMPLITIETAEKKVLREFVKLMHLVPEPDRNDMATRMIGTMIGLMGVPKARLRAIDPPEEIRLAMAA